MSGGYYLCPLPCGKLHETIADKEKCEESNHGLNIPREWSKEKQKLLRVARRR